MIVVRTVGELRDALAEARGAGERVGLVPTMGSFHEGHRELMRRARGGSDVVVVSLFVNPTQFTDPDDLARYPRDEVGDARVAEAEAVDVLFAPTDGELYPRGFETTVDPGPLANVLEGASRPGHFRAVATICTKLFNIVQPRAAWFGQKDAQQLAVIRRVVADLDLAVEIVAVPTVRDPDGLALSSRNARLSPADRQAALALPRAIRAGVEAHRTGADPAAAARAELARSRAISVDYVEAVDLDGLTLVAAIRVGGVRLIDNAPLERVAARSRTPGPGPTMSP